MTRVCALTSGLHVPSARFRVRQHIHELRRHDIEVTEFIPKIDKYADLPEPLGGASTRRGLPPVYWTWAGARLLSRVPGILAARSFDVTWLEREFQPGFPTFETLLKKPVVFDVDDAIWLKRPLGAALARKTARHAAALLAGNEYIADWFSGYNGQVHVIPTAVDTERFRPSQSPPPADFSIAWTGTSATLRYLYTIEKALAQFLHANRDAHLVVISDQRPYFEHIDSSRISFEAWNENTESEVLRTCHVGIMPLLEDEWSRGKCGFKLLQYMATGLPVVATAVGVNNDILNKLGPAGHAASSNDDWYDALQHVHDNPQFWDDWGTLSRAVAVRDYSIPVIAEALASVFSQFG